MPTYVPDGAKEEEFSALPAGFYDVIIEAVDPGYSQKDGSEYLTWVLVVTNEEYNGSKLWHRTSMKKNAVAFPGSGFYAVLSRFGLTEHFTGKDMEFEDLAAELAEIAPGLTAKVAVSVYVYNGKNRNDCDEFFKTEGGPPHQLFAAGSPEAQPRATSVKGSRPSAAVESPY